MKEIIQFLRDELKLNQHDTLVVSVSGGSDSMALLHMLTKTTTYQIVVVHFNHQKRNASIDEANLVAQYCKDHDLPFHYYALEIPFGNFHHRAHELRTHYLNEVAKVHKTPYILTAHHLDDLFENVLIKLTRGSNLLGYAGMQRIHKNHNFIYVKPFLYLTKKEIQSYITKHNIHYLDDDSNEEHTYLRNRYRHAVVPLMKQENEMLLEQIKNYHNQITSAFHFIRKETLHFLGSDMTINIEQYCLLDEVLKDDCIACLFEHHHLPFNYRMIQKLKDILLSDKPNVHYTLSNRYSFVKSYQQAFIKRVQTIEQQRIELKEGKTTIKNMAIFTFFDESKMKSTESAKLCYNKLAFPLFARRREDGDILSYPYGHKKLKKLLIDEKVSKEKREQLLIITDSEDNILWVPGYYLNQTLGDEHEIYFYYKEDINNA
jgi:bifunctional protein TilS/HprT